jgi:hypothetical protein
MRTDFTPNCPDAKRLGQHDRHFGTPLPLLKRLRGRFTPKNSAFWRRVEKVGLKPVAPLTGRQAADGVEEYHTLSTTDTDTDTDTGTDTSYSAAPLAEMSRLPRRTVE